MSTEKYLFTPGTGQSTGRF